MTAANQADGFDRRTANLALLVLFCLAVLNYVDRALVTILQVPIQAELKLTDTQLGALTGLAFSLLYATCALPMAWLVDRFERRRLLALAVAVWSAMTALGALAGSFGTLMACRMGVAVGESVTVPATHSLIADHFPATRRGTAVAVWALAGPVGMMLGIAVGGWLAALVGWRWTMALIGGFGLCAAPLVLLMKEPPRGRFDLVVNAGPIDIQTSLKVLWELRSFRYLVIAATLSSYAQASAMNWAAPFYSRIHGLTLSEIAMFLGLFTGVAGGAGAFMGGVLADRLARRSLRWYVLLPCVVSLVVVPLALGQYLAGSTTLSLVLGALASFGLVVFIAPVNVAAQSLVPSTMRGLTAAILLVVPTILGVGLGPLITGLISDVLMDNSSLGEDSLRYALAHWPLLLVAAVAAYWFAARHLAADIRARASDAAKQDGKLHSC